MRSAYNKALAFAAKRMLVVFPDSVSSDPVGFLPSDLRSQAEGLPLSVQRKFIETSREQAPLVAARAADLAVTMAQSIADVAGVTPLTADQRARFSDAIARRAVSDSIRTTATKDLAALVGEGNAPKIPSRAALPTPSEAHGLRSLPYRP